MICTRYARGQCVAYQDAHLHQALRVEEGVVHVRTHAPSPHHPHAQIIAVVETGEFVLPEVLIAGVVSPYSAWAATACVVSRIGTARLETLQWRDLHHQVAAHALGRAALAGSIARDQVTERVHRALVYLAERPSAATHPDGMQIRVSRQDLAAMVGASREMAGRALTALAERGVVDVHMTGGKTMVVRREPRDPEAAPVAGVR